MKSILLLHGALGSKNQMQKLATALSVHFDVHSFYLIGHGKRSGETVNFSIDDLTADLDNYTLPS